MRKSEIKKNLKTAISKSVPDVLDNILVECEKKKGFEKNMGIIKKEDKVKKEFNLKYRLSGKLVGVLAMCMICLVGMFAYGQYNENYTVASVVEFDVNPSIEIEVNKKEKIIGVTPLNEDGKKIIGDMDLIDADVDVAVNAIVGSMLKNGYISTDNNSILVSVKNDNAEEGSKLQERISKNIEELLNMNSINGSILTQAYVDDNEINTLAQQHNISEGKASLINQLTKSEIKNTKGNAITAEELSKLSINELNLLLTSKNTELSNINTKGSASESLYIGKEKAKEIALNNANLTGSAVPSIDVELDYDNGKLVYEVDFRHNNIEYDYEIDATTGDILESEQENDGVTDYGTNNDGATNYDDTDYGPNNDGVTDYNDTDYGPNNDGVTDYNDTDYGPNNDGVTDYNNNTNYETENEATTDYDDNDDDDDDDDDNNSNYGDSNYDN